jgi:hypothetical protein
LVNVNESPLAQLARRRGKCGAPFSTTGIPGGRASAQRLHARQYHAEARRQLGDQRGQRQTRRRSGIAELTDAALAARQRVEQAIEAVGPELAGVLIDVCCFLKGSRPWKPNGNGRLAARRSY